LFILQEIIKEKTDMENSCLNNSITKFKLMFASIEMVKNQSSCKNKRPIVKQEQIRRPDKKIISHFQNVDTKTSLNNVVNRPSNGESGRANDDPKKTSLKSSNVNSQNVTIKGETHCESFWERFFFNFSLMLT
jgi:hypothetical protein